MFSRDSLVAARFSLYDKAKWRHGEAADYSVGNLADVEAILVHGTRYPWVPNTLKEKRETMKKTVLALAVMAGSLGMAQAGTLLSEDFNDVTTLGGKGWVQTNASTPVGLTGWFQGNTGVFAAASGPADSYIAANFLNAGSGGVISNWLLTPELLIASIAPINFSLRLLGDGLLDTVEVYVSTNGASTALGDFQLLQSFSSTTDTGWTNESVAYTGLTAGSGRYAFRYLVDNTNLDGNYIGIDSVSVVPEPASAALFGIAILGLALSRRKVAAKQ